ncbi:peptidoglycan-binding protein [Micromonospora sp. NPDC050397]|uniref:peptidoglycan-binding protein n=1 Tax=Micromonospora sp. NPDC050397 TaxID=3364279 RepID=UPI00384AE21E
MPQGDADGKDVTSVATSGEFVALLRQLRDDSGLTYREIERRAVAAGHWLPRSTLATLLSRTTLPREELVVALLTACGTPSSELERWRRVRQELADGSRVAVGPDRPTPTPTPTPNAEPEPVSVGPGRGAAGAVAADGVTATAAGAAAGRRRPRWRWSRLAMIAVGFVMVTALAGAGLVTLEPPADARRPSGATPLLLSDDCPETLAIGAVSKCVQDLQERMRIRGLDLPADGWFGPHTKMRVMAFQALSDLPPTSIVDEETKRALYAESIPLPTWSKDEVERALRASFPEDPDGAVRVASCLSELDPYWIFGYSDGSRRWGLFQFSDRELKASGVGPPEGLSLGWSVATARTIWSRTRDFSHWNCPPPG